MQVFSELAQRIGPRRVLWRFDPILLTAELGADFYAKRFEDIATRLAGLFSDRAHVTKAQPTREECGCVASRDIGVYDTCGYGCAYWYANQDHQTALKRVRAHDPERETLTL